MVSLRVAIATGFLLLLGATAHAADRFFAVYVYENDPLVMKRALVNAVNVERYFQGKGDTAQIEIVATGPGAHMLRADTSPVGGLVLAVGAISSNIKFSVSGDTLKQMEKKEGAVPPVIEAARVVPSGAQRLKELQEKGYRSISYSLLMAMYFERDKFPIADRQATPVSDQAGRRLGAP